MAMTTIQWAGLTDTGRVRDHNEDDFFIHPVAGVAAVADGMGGHEAGEVASALAVNTLRMALVEDAEDLPTAMIRAHRAILAHPQGGGVGQGRGRLGMGTTAVAVRVRESEAEFCWVGDSRAYLLQDGRLAPVSRDHTPVQEMVDRGLISVAQARLHPRRNEITQALGVAYEDRIIPGLAKARIAPGDILLLCSDGLTEHLPDSLLEEILASGGRSLEGLAERLVREALDAGGSDNITVVLGRARG